MSEVSRPSHTERLVDDLFPKIVANHVSKLEEFEATSYGVILDTMSEPRPLEERLHRIATMSGRVGVLETLAHEVSILRLGATGREDQVSDAKRQMAYARSDRNQMVHAKGEKDLDYYLRHGIEIVFPPNAREEAREHAGSDTRDVPLLEKLKAKRLLEINGFDNSRVMYAVHDLVDHAWLFDQMREKGIMERYDDFLKSIEMEDGAFLYSRQAELLASVGFGSRRWYSSSVQDESLVLDKAKIESVLQTTEDTRAIGAKQLLDGMSPKNLHQAVFMIENMALQFADERRRWGAVKQVDESGDRRPMDLFEPLHIAMMIETLHMLQESQIYDNVQLVASVQVNSMLEDVIADKSSDERLWVPVPRLNPGDKVNFNDTSSDWIRRHISVSTSYNRIG